MLQFHADLKNSDYMDDFRSNGDFLYLGIDAGMFKTSICTSDGKKFSERTVLAVVKETGNNHEEQVLTGTEALQLLNGNVICPLDGGLKNENDVNACRQFLKNVLKKHNVDTGRGLTYAILGVPTNVEKDYKKKLLELSREIFSGAMLVDEIFCMAYHHRILEKSLLVDIGFRKTDICIINGDLPEETDYLSLSIAGSDIDREIAKLLTERWPDSQITDELVRQWKEQCCHMPASADCVVDVPFAEGCSKESVKDEMRIACELIVTDIVSGIIRVLSEADPGIRESLRYNIHIFGGTSNLDGMGTFIEKELKQLGGGKVFLDLDSVYGISEGALELARNMPPEFWKLLTASKEDKEMLS